MLRARWGRPYLSRVPESQCRSIVVFVSAVDGEPPSLPGKSGSVDGSGPRYPSYTIPTGRGFNTTPGIRITYVAFVQKNCTFRTRRPDTFWAGRTKPAASCVTLRNSAPPHTTEIQVLTVHRRLAAFGEDAAPARSGEFRPCHLARPRVAGRRSIRVPSIDRHFIARRPHPEPGFAFTTLILDDTCALQYAIQVTPLYVIGGSRQA
jgi:hypothetical protein